jgi:hypothetical protein
MKTKIAIASAFLAASSFSTAEIVINDFLSFEGFVDMSYSHTDQEVGAGEANNNTYGLDQVEISWLFDFDPVTAQIDVQHLDGQGTSTGATVEQAFATYHFSDGSSFTAGRFASMLGFEAFEPTGLYQYSFAYLVAEDLASPFATDGGILPGYDQGIKYTYEGDSTFFGISLVDGTDVGRLGGPTLGGDSGYSIEIAGALNYDNGISWFGGARYNEGDNNTYDDQFILNSYVTFETGAWIFAAELVYGETDFGAPADEETLTALLMANFAYSDAASVTGRLSFLDTDFGAADESFVKYTLAHGYAFTDNLFLVNEISYVDGETVGNADVKTLTMAAELIFSF